MMEGTQRSIRLYFTADVERPVLEFLQGRLTMFFPSPVHVGRQIVLQEDEFVHSRRQYRASLVLKRLHTLGHPEDFRLAITGADLFEGGLNFVFGAANPRLGCAIISLNRLHLKDPERPLTRELFDHRVLTEAVHEIGHLAGLRHCPKATCAMHFSNTLAETDRKGPGFCEDCRSLLDEV